MWADVLGPSPLKILEALETQRARSTRAGKPRRTSCAGSSSSAYTARGHVRDHREEPTPERVAPAQKTDSFTQTRILKAIGLLDEREKQKDIAELTQLSTHNVRRVRLMYEGGLLDVNERGKLWVDERVRLVPRGRVMLRYWGADGRSSDPIEHPPR